MRIPFCSLALLVIASSAATGAEYYVSTTGNNSQSGAINSPFATVGRGLTAALPGDSVIVRGGTYSERISFPTNGTAAAPIVLKAYPGETPVFDLSSQTVPSGQGDEPVIAIRNRSHLVVQGLTIQNWRTDSSQSLPEGILIASSGSNAVSDVRLLGNTIHHIEQNDPSFRNFDANGHGIKVAGRSTVPMTGIVIDRNTLHSMRLGASETLAINGNVTQFRVTNNVVHDSNNIGIDFIGYENPSMSPALDRARDGVCSGNVVYNIDSRFNPAYGGDFTTGGGDASAAGIYVDGGSNIIIERNLVYACNYGVELATEEDLANNGKADFITLRNNLIRHNHQSGLILGGYNSSKGTTTNCTIANNTFYQNGSFGSTVQIFGQHHVVNNVFKNNVIVTTPGTRLTFGVFPGSAATTFTGNTFSYNLYFSAAGVPVFDVSSQYSPSTWQTATALSGGDTGSTVGNPLFEEATPVATSPVAAYEPGSNSPMINTGQPSPAYQHGSGEKDLLERSRVRGGRVDRGAIEH